jgi:hypothetical protein
MIHIDHNNEKSIFRLQDIFEDDHEMCCVFMYKNHKFTLWWSTLEVIGAFEYPDSPKAQHTLEGLSDLLDRIIADPEEMQDSDERHSKWGYIVYGNE